MDLPNSRKTEARKIYETYWESYSKGDLETFASTLDDHYEMIGTSETEVCHSKADGIAFLKAQVHEVVGKTEMRNRQIDVLPVENLMLINEQCDVYVLTDSDLPADTQNWNFYSKIRLSTILRETESGWKVTQQHGSFPDMRVQEGETLALEKINKENLELRDAVKRRTAELENKNRELAIEAALEKVRAVAMGMKKPEDMLDVCREISDRLQDFGVTKIRNVQTAIIDETIGQYLCYQYFTPYEKTEVEKTEYLKSPVEHAMVRQMLASKDGYFIGGLSGRELEEFRSHRKEENHFPDPFLDEATALNYCFLSIGEGGLGLTLYQPLVEDILTLFKRFHQVFSLAYQRFRDIQKAEAHARESEIDLALERVRAQTMAMHSSEDVGKCVVKMFSELTALGVDEGTRFGIGILNHDNENNQLWTARKDGDEVNMHIGNIDMASHPLLKSARNAWKEQVPLHHYVLEGEDLVNYYQMLNNAPDYKIQIPLEKLPEKEIQHCFIFEHGFFYAFSPREFQPDLIHITQRFSSLFEQTYRRYLDLVRAEAQAREAEIELALERVRARTMHHTEELKEVIQVVFDQFVGLNIHVEHAGFILDYKEREDMHIWLATLQQGVPTEITIPYFDSPHWNSYLEAKARQESFFANLLPFEVKNKFYRDLFEWIPELTEEAQQAIFSKPALAISTVLLDNVGLYIEHYSMTPYTAEENAVLMRFGKVFQQTYTRFLDLQKAEAQAREAQIEGALERIRSRSLAMRTSDELEDVIMVVSEQLQQLQFRFHNVSFSSNNEQSDIIFWLATPGKTKPFLIKAPYLDTPSVTRIIDARKNGIDFLSDVFTTEENQEWLQHTVNNSQSNLSEDDKKFLMTRKGMARSAVLTKNITLMLVNYAGVPFTDQQNFILKRFGNVFDQSYTRFLDLQKAEAQAREAQVNLAVERVRARALAMFKSEEILQVVHKLKDEIMGLNIPNVAAATIHLKEPDGMCRVWDLTSLEIEDDGLHLPLDIRFRLEDTHRDFFMRRIWENEADYFVVIQKDSDFKHTLQWLHDNDQSKHADEAEEFFRSTQLKKAYHPTVPLNNGRMNLDLLDTPDPEIEAILKKMAGAFDLAYKRFEDLQKAEAQAREAQIEAGLERVRSKSLAMHKTAELQTVIHTVHQELLNLNISISGGSFIVINSEIDNEIQCWGSGGTADTSDEVHIPHFDKPFYTHLLDGIKNGPGFFTEEYSQDEKIEFFTFLFQHEPWSKLSAKEKNNTLSAPGGYTRSCAVAKHTSIFIINHFGERFSEAENAILKRFGKVFEQSYTRFLDLQKAEAQAREAQIEAALERIRAKGMAMHHSGELKDVLTVLFNQFDILGIKPVQAQLSLFDLENNRFSFRSTGKGGRGNVGEQVIDMDAMDTWKETIDTWKASKPKSISTVYFPKEILPQLWALFDEVRKQLPEEDIITQEDYPDGVYVTEGNFNYGYIGFSHNRKATAEEEDIVIRFATEFGRLYQRFLDLQKAESQAREAQIQLSLERIRAKAMAMQHSDELSGFLTVVFEQFEVLQLNPVNCHLSLLDLENNRSIFRLTGKNGATLIASQEIDLDASAVLKQKLMAWKSGNFMDVDVLFTPFESLPEFAIIFKEILDKMPEEDRPLPEDWPDGQYVIEGYCKYGYLGYSASRAPSDEEKEITRRIANEFGNVYQRFIDLQKAESQAREAQIQLSLERIRAKAMSMLHSDELSDFLTVVFEQFHVLNLRPVASQLSFLDIDNNRSILRLTGKNGATLIATQEVDLDASPFWKQKVEDFKSGQPNDVDVVFVPYDKIPEIVEILKEILAKLPEDERPLPEDFPNGQYIVEGTFKYGYLGYSATGPPSDEEKEITHRIAHEFGNVYQRFLDLQKAEAQTREAQIQLSLERIRAKAMAMQHSDELSGFLTVLFEQFEVLNLSPVYCHLTFFDIDNNRSTFRMTGKKGATLIATQEVDLDASPIWKQQIEEWKAGNPNDVDVLYIPFESIPGVAEIFKEILEKLPDDERPLQGDFPDGQYVIQGYCKYGYLGYNATGPASDEEMEITRRIANEFGNVYQRFIDLQKAEAQAREAQIENALEKVRSRTMAMQRSDELTDVAGLLFNQVSALGIKTWTAGFNVWSEDNNSYVDYLSLNGEIFGPNTVHTEKVEALKELSNARKSGVEFDVLYMEGEKIKQLHMAHGRVDEKEYDRMLNDGLLPSHEYEHFVFGAKVSVMFITYEPVPEAHDIFKRLGKVFEQTYTRFLDLQKAEDQAREAQIENALEKVRSRTMAMQRSDELTDVAGLLFNQVSALGIKTWTAGFNVWSEDNNSYVDYLSLNGEIYGPNTVHTEKAEALKELSNVRKSGVEFDVLYVEGEKIKELYLAISGIDEKEYDIMVKDGLLPSQQYEHFVFGAKVSVMFITYEPVPEAHDIFKRLGKVFEQTYTRFLDLQKAEAQAREAKIEGALEKVRSRTMGMQSSDELPEVANLLFTEVRALGIHAWSCGYNILAEDKKSATCCMSSEGTLQTPFQLRLWGENSFDEMGEFVLSDHTMLVQELGDKALEEHYTYMKSFPDLKPTFDEIDRLGLSLPTYQINHLCKFNQGFILFITYEKVPESHAIFKRFTNVFDQTYTRFLDLKKAEAQARESEIEVAIEKVRSRSLAMHKSDELKDVVFSVFERLRDLQIQTDSTNIVVYFDESAKMEFWAANEMNYSMKFSLPMTGRFYPMEGIEARKAQKAFCQHLPFEEKNKFWKELFNTPDFRKVPEARKNFLLEKTECLIQLVAFGKVTGIMLNRHFNNPFSDADLEITERFAKVFDQAYTRFLDLQKAEAQAREAQIANSLEKVRSRSLAMQSPDELIEVAQLLREEMGALGVEELETSSIYIQEDHSGSTQCWFTIKNPDNPEKAITDQMTLDLQDTWVGRKMDEFVRSKATQTSILMQGEQRIEWIRYCEEKTELFGTSNFYGETIPDRTYHLYKFSNGYIGAAAPGEISSESWELLKRATAVFSFAYTRFRDLQMAQSSARAAVRQASLDRVRAEISSMRHVDDLDRITPLFFHELTTLGIPFIRCGVFIIQEKQEIVEAYLSSPDGNSLGILRLPYQASELTYKTVEAWRKGVIYRQHWNKVDFVNWINQLMEQDQIQDSSTYQGTAAPPESLDLHFVPFAQGMLYVGSENPLDEKELELVQALAKAFSIAYARYEDFVRLEHAKAEIESAMNELKATQSQLVQQEKLASLGQLTAGIAHEIKNPLNFVNNFSEVSIELVDEAIEERSKSQEARDETLVDEILIDIKSNLQKVHEHGSRANGIVTSMLQHSRGGSGKMASTDLNAMIKEYVNLSFHGMRANKNPIDVELAFDLDPEIKEVPLIKEDFIRVIINLCNNAFDAMRGKKYLVSSIKYQDEAGNDLDYLPKLKVRTSLENGQVRISLADNGPGIPDDIKDKILQPFFTTKKGTEGTGLGLSITHDIVKAHGGSLSVESNPNGSIFTITIPTN